MYSTFAAMRRKAVVSGEKLRGDNYNKGKRKIITIKFYRLGKKQCIFALFPYGSESERSEIDDLVIRLQVSLYIDLSQ